ncbi:putative transcriptional regulator, LysR family [Cupriavidus taiwanensis LMG 19424]|uniref:Transcriptional regulator, LysR family n=1 Tax=Cupriavidus taiwanensis (strain DSM 17343 / BCRC 17206 / CCUG 44338 / CIP 107171 / LMG 19424 / R1) TaxID=977880 RepID=B3RBB9_CUPTR|nr:putative transcriptional regulator, LysR family [Cupriavidus taiwanensis LMG 19424]
MDNARVLTLFLGVVRVGSFRRAAVEAGVTPQAASKAVRTLETYLGVRLLHRTTRKLSLTEEGARLFELTAPGMRQLDEALEQVRASRSEDDGLIRLTAPPSLGSRVLVPLVKGFREQHPGIGFDVVLSDLFTDLVEARIDVGFRVGTSPGQNLVARRLCDLPLVICAAPDYLARHGAPATLDELMRHPCTGFRRPATGRMVPWELHVDGNLVYREIPAVASFNDVETEVEAVRAGIGIGQLPAYMVHDDLVSGRLRAILPGYSSSQVGLYMYYPHRSQMPGSRQRQPAGAAAAGLGYGGPHRREEPQGGKRTGRMACGGGVDRPRHCLICCGAAVLPDCCVAAMRETGRRPAKRRPHHFTTLLYQALSRCRHWHMSLPANLANNALTAIAGRESHHARQSRCHPHRCPARACGKRQDLAGRSAAAQGGCAAHPGQRGARLHGQRQRSAGAQVQALAQFRHHPRRLPRHPHLPARYTGISRFFRPCDQCPGGGRDRGHRYQRADRDRNDHAPRHGLGAVAATVPDDRHQRYRRREGRPARAAGGDPGGVRQGMPAHQPAGRKRRQGGGLLLQSGRRVGFFIGGVGA